MNLQEYLCELQFRVEKKLQHVLPISENPLHAAMAYSVLNGGKRFRPVLIYATAEALKLDLNAVDDIACAVELIHCYSLIHDDLPDMDNDDWRRGKPTCHKAYDNATAILAGDALQTLAFELTARPNKHVGAEEQLHIQSILTEAIGANGMAYGQALDMMGNKDLTEEEVRSIHINKTGKFIKACVEMATAAASCEDDNIIENLSVYGDCLGLAFQVKDDILDVEGTIDNIGKLPGMDRAQNKATYPGIMGLAKAKHELEKLHQGALTALENIQLSETRLAELANFVVMREK